MSTLWRGRNQKFPKNCDTLGLFKFFGVDQIRVVLGCF